MYSILVCDDDKEIVEAIEIYLTQEGYQVLKAYDGMQALKMLETETVHLFDSGCYDAENGRMGSLQTDSQGFQSANYYVDGKR